MKLRAQLPARSPLGLAAIGAAASAWLAPGRRPGDALVAKFGGAFGAHDALLTDSGTSALRLALQAAVQNRPGGVVALPAWGCYDLATAADGAGVSVVLYDLDPATLGPDLDSLRRILTDDVAAVVVAHYYGIPVDMAAVHDAAAAAGALVIEDAAQAIGATLHGRPAGGIGPVAVLSFGRGKGVTGGGGGALLGHRPPDGFMAGARAGMEPANRGTRELVGLSALWVLGRPAVYGIPSALPFLNLGRTVYHPPHQPRGMPAAAAAALGRAWPGALAEVSIRRRTAARLLEVVPAALKVTPPADSAPSWLRMPVVLDAAAAAAADTPAARTLGIFRGYPLSLADLPGFARIRNAGDPFPGARRLASGLLTLPTHGQLAERDVRALTAWLEAR